jgi:hypothetical protein
VLREHGSEHAPAVFSEFRINPVPTEVLTSALRQCTNQFVGGRVPAAPLFQSLHSPEQFRGKCGECEFSYACGGSRARAFARTGDVLESDPFCSYQIGEPITGCDVRSRLTFGDQRPLCDGSCYVCATRSRVQDMSIVAALGYIMAFDARRVFRTVKLLERAVCVNDGNSRI